MADGPEADVKVPGYRDVPTGAWNPAAPLDLDEAERFLRQCYAEQPSLGDFDARWAEVRAEVAATGTYVHTRAELVFGARVAWRNSSRCIGRLYWRSLVVRDCRAVRGSEEIFDQLVDHLRLASGRGPDSRSEPAGLIRPVISIFRPARPDGRYARVWNEQLIRYAGYRTSAGVVGDPRYVEFTEAMIERGWWSKGEAFDILPVVVETPEEGVRLYELPESAVLEVQLVHPEYDWFADLGLRWHVVPAISHMRLVIGGVHYPLAPFNGWYLGTEIGARNLADIDRYNLLPVVARRLGLDTSRESTLWRDRALVELTRAVLHSFDRAGARITDHHTESRRFLTHVEREERHGRQVPADWTWIVPPISGGATPVFHRYYHEADLRPNFYLDEPARRLAVVGRPEAVARGAAAIPSQRAPAPEPATCPADHGPGRMTGGRAVG